MPELFPWFLYLHVIGAIIAFGPTFSLPFINAMAGRESVHGNFVARASLMVSGRIIIPVALSLAVTGGGLIWSKGIDLLAADYRWLVLAVALYVVGIAFSITVQTAAVRRIVELTSAPPPAAAPPGAAAPAAPAPAGPPPELMATVRRARMGGQLLAVIVLAIAFLMVVKPTLGG